MKKLFLITMLFYAGIAYGQSIGVGIGYTSSGDVPVMFSASGKNAGAYISYVAESHPITPTYTGTWHKETVIGLSYEISAAYPELKILAGAGFNSTTVWFRDSDFPHAIHSTIDKAYSYEVGFEIRPFEKCKFLYLNAVINSYTGLKTMVCFSYEFN